MGIDVVTFITGLTFGIIPARMFPFGLKALSFCSQFSSRQHFLLSRPKGCTEKRLPLLNSIFATIYHSYQEVAIAKSLVKKTPLKLSNKLACFFFLPYTSSSHWQMRWPDLKPRRERIFFPLLLLYSFRLVIGAIAISYAAIVVNTKFVKLHKIK